MYTIGHVIYGFGINEAQNKVLRAWDQCKVLQSDGTTRKMTEEEQENESMNPDSCGFTMIYSGDSSGYVGYCGVLLATIGPWETTNLDSAKWTATDEQKTVALEAIKKLHPDLQAKADPIGHYIVWGTS